MILKIFYLKTGLLSQEPYKVKEQAGKIWLPRPGNINTSTYVADLACRQEECLIRNLLNCFLIGEFYFVFKRVPISQLTGQTCINHVLNIVVNQAKKRNPIATLLLCNIKNHCHLSTMQTRKFAKRR